MIQRQFELKFLWIAYWEAYLSFNTEDKLSC